MFSVTSTAPMTNVYDDDYCFSENDVQAITICDVKPNDGIVVFFIPNQDHTLGCLLKNSLLRDSRLKWAGYRMDNPVNGDFIQVTLHFHDPINCITNAKNVLLDHLNLLTNELGSIEKQFQQQLIKFATTSRHLTLRAR